MTTAPSFTHEPDLDLRLERLVDVAVDLVWRVWTEPEHVMAWFTPRPWQTIACEIDLRPGGRFATVMRDPDGKRVPERRLLPRGASPDPAGVHLGPAARVPATALRCGGAGVHCGPDLRTGGGLHPVLGPSDPRQPRCGGGARADEVRRRVGVGPRPAGRAQDRISHRRLKPARSSSSGSTTKVW